MKASRIGSYLRRLSSLSQRYIPLRPSRKSNVAGRFSASAAQVAIADGDGASGGQEATVLPLSPEVDFVRARIGNLVTLHNDIGVSETIRDTGVWAARDVDLFPTIIEQGMFVADVGAYIGHHSVLFSRLVGSNGLVVAFEPQRVPFRALNCNLLLNDCDNVDAINCALGADIGFGELWPHKTKDNFGAVPIVKRKHGAIPIVEYKGEVSYGQGGQRVEISTLDVMLSRYRNGGRKLDFVKIDTQAYELFVLRGAAEVLEIDRPKIFFEVSPFWMDQLMGYDYLDIYKFLERYDYLVVDAHGDHRTPTERRWSGDQDEEWDCLAVPKSS